MSEKPYYWRTLASLKARKISEALHGLEEDAQELIALCSMVDNPALAEQFDPANAKTLMDDLRLISAHYFDLSRYQ